MPLHMAFCCDTCPDDSQTARQPFDFDSLTDNFADLLQTMGDLGWRIDVDLTQPAGKRIPRSICPACVEAGR